MRIAHVTTFYPPYNFGGDGIVVQRFARALARRGHEVTVVHDIDTFEMLGGTVDVNEACAGEQTLGHGTVSEHDDDGVRVVRVRGRPRALSGLLTHQLGRPVLTARALRDILDRESFDVVHFHNVSMVGGPGILAYGRGAVKLYTAHEHWLVCPMHILWKLRREPCDSRACFRCTLSNRRPPQMYRYTGYMRRQLEHVDVFFAQTEFSRQKHMSFGFEPLMEVLSPFLPDTDLDTGVPDTATGADSPETPLEPPHRSWNDGRPFVFFAGRLEKMKGLDDIIPAFRHDPPAELLIAGDGVHRGELERLAIDCDAVRFLGQVPNRDVQSLMRGATAVLVPTTGYETFGFTALEAFRAGTPVVARRRGPLPELIERSGGGLLFDHGDEAIDAIRTIVQDTALRGTLANAGRAAFKAFWSEDVVMPRYLARIESLLSERRATQADVSS
jgi:glycosyltransferase involved in cell wall biosynthesis